MATRPSSHARVTSVKCDKHQWRSEAMIGLGSDKKEYPHFDPCWNGVRLFPLVGRTCSPPRASLTIPHALSTFYISFYFTAAHSSKLNILTPPRFCQKSVRWTCATSKIQIESDKIKCEQQLYEMLSKIMQCLHIKTPWDMEQQELRIWRVSLYWDGSFRIRNIRHRLKWKGWILKAEVRRIN